MIMSTLTLLSAIAVNTAAATPGWSGTSLSVTLASDVSCVTPEMMACSMVSSALLDYGAGRVVEARAAVDDHAVVAGELDGAHLQDAGAARGHLEHLLVGDAVELARVRDDARVGGVDAVDVGVDLAYVGADAGRHRDGGRVPSLLGRAW